MTALLPLADHGNAVSALPFVVPMLLIVGGLLFLVLRDRIRSRADDSQPDTPSSHA
jgi:hypothetical protein